MHADGSGPGHDADAAEAETVRAEQTPRFANPRLQAVHAIIAAKAIIHDKQARILAPDGRGNNWLLDVRMALLDPLGLELIAAEFWERFAQRLPFQVGGIELAAVPLVSAIQMEGRKRGLSVNGFIVRRERKTYALSRSWEGELTDDPVIVVDDTFNSASSVEKVRLVLAQTGRSIGGVFAVVDYQSPPGRAWLARNRVRMESLFTLAQFGIRQSPPPSIPKQAEFAEAWHFSASGGHYFHIEPASTPALDEASLYFGSDSGVLWALDQRSGTELWQFSAGGTGLKRIRSSPAVHQGRVYFASWEGNVHCLDGGSGKEEWRFGGAERIESSPALAPELGLLFIGLEHALPGRRGSIAALHLGTGEKVWEFAVQGPVRASPSYDSSTGMLACGTEDGELLLFEPKARKLLWRFAAGGAIRAAAAFDPIRHSVLVGTLDGSIHSISAASGTARWSFKTEDRICSTPLIVGDHVYVTSTDKRLYVADAETGKLVRRIPVRGKIHASPRLIGGRVYFGCTAGTVYEIDPADGAITGQVALPERITDAVVHSRARGLFYARSYDGQIYAFRRLTHAGGDPSG